MYLFGDGLGDCILLFMEEIRLSTWDVSKTCTEWDISDDYIYKYPQYVVQEVFSLTTKDPFVCRPKKGISPIQSYEMGRVKKILRD